MFLSFDIIRSCIEIVFVVRCLLFIVRCLLVAVRRLLFKPAARHAYACAAEQHPLQLERVMLRSLVASTLVACVICYWIEPLDCYLVVLLGMSFMQLITAALFPSTLSSCLESRCVACSCHCYFVTQ